MGSDVMFFGVVLMLGLFGFVVMHEQVHVQIYESYGIDSRVEWFSHFPSVVTIGESACPTEMCVLAHNMNEVVGYVAMVFYVVFGFFGILLLKLLEDFNKVKAL